MAATIAVQETAGQRASAPTFTERINVTGDTSYPTGGYPLGLATLFPGRTVVAVHVQPNTGGTGIFFQYDYSLDQLLFLDGAGAEVAGATNVSADTAVVTVTFK